MRFTFITLVFSMIISYTLSEPVCFCSDEAICSVWGDPHLDSFYGIKKRIPVDKGIPINIYTHKDFVISATTFKRDLMDNITFGNSYWHKEQCKRKKKTLAIKKYTFEDGSIITGLVKCDRYRKKLHLNLYLTKTVPLLGNYLSFQQYEEALGSTGVCNTL